MGLLGLLFLYTICMTPGGWLIDRYGPKAALLLVCFGSAVFVSLTGVIGLLVAGSALVPALFLIRCLGAVTSPIHPGSARMVSHWIPVTGQGVCNGVATGAACLGIASTYLIFGRFMDKFGWPGAFLVSGSVTVLMGATWLLLAADYRRTRSGTICRSKPNARLLPARGRQGLRRMIAFLRRLPSTARQEPRPPRRPSPGTPWMMPETPLSRLLKNSSLRFLTIS